MPKLDFVVIGGQKCGTTTLHQLLSQHPNLQMPADKESPVFHREVSTAEADRFLEETFETPRSPHGVIGKVTPHYLATASAAARLKAHSPNAKIIVLVRNPVNRALSAHRMMVRRDREPLAAAPAFREELNRLVSDAGTPTDQRSYLAGSRWMSLIEPYTEQFASVTVRTLFDLQSDPVALLDDINQLLGVEPFHPPDVGMAYNVAAARKPWVDRWGRKVAKGPLRPLWRRLPEKRRREIAFRFETLGQSVKPAAAPPSISNEIDLALLAELELFFEVDTTYLHDRFGVATDRLAL